MYILCGIFFTFFFFNLSTLSLRDEHFFESGKSVALDLRIKRKLQLVLIIYDTELSNKQRQTWQTSIKVVNRYTISEEFCA